MTGMTAVTWVSRVHDKGKGDRTDTDSAQYHDNDKSDRVMKISRNWIKKNPDPPEFRYYNKVFYKFYIWITLLVPPFWITTHLPHALFILKYCILVTFEVRVTSHIWLVVSRCKFLMKLNFSIMIGRGLFEDEALHHINQASGAC